jgi:hypothetical protein
MYSTGDLQLKVSVLLAVFCAIVHEKYELPPESEPAAEEFVSVLKADPHPWLRAANLTVRHLLGDGESAQEALQHRSSELPEATIIERRVDYALKRAASEVLCGKVSWFPQI